MSPESAPQLRPWAAFSPRLALRLTSIAALAALTSAACGAWWPDAGPASLAAIFVSGLLGLGTAVLAERARSHPVARCLFVGAGGGVALAVILLVVALASLEGKHTDLVFLGFALAAAFLGVIGLGVGLLLGLVALTFRGLPEDARDADDEVRRRMAAWLVLAGGLAAWATPWRSAPVHASAHLLVLGLGAAAAGVAWIRDLSRLRWLGRALGGDPRWTEIEATAEHEELPVYIGLGDEPAEAVLAYRTEAGSTPFRDGSRLVPVVRVDPGAALVRQRLRFRAAFSAATLVGAALFLALRLRG